MINQHIDLNSCQAYWPLQGNINDKVGANHLTGYTYGGSVNSSLTYTDGIAGRALDLGSNSRYLHVDTDFGFHLHDWTVEGWATITSYPILVGLFSNRGNNTPYWWNIGFYSGSIYLESTPWLQTLNIVPALGTWHKYTVTYDYNNSNLSAYYDEDKIVTISVSPVASGTGLFQIGNWYNNGGKVIGPEEAWPGKISHVMVYNKCKTADEVASSYHFKRSAICG